MLFAPPPEFSFRVSNYSSVRPGSWGTVVTASATPDTYGSYTEILSDTLVTQDCYGIGVATSSSATAGSNSGATFTIGKDETGGTSYTDWLTDLICGGGDTASKNRGATYYYFPLFIKAGTAFAAKAASAIASKTVSVRISLFGGLRNPEHYQVASKFQAFGASAGNGTAITPGNAAEGSWTQIGSNPSSKLWWWQWGAQCRASAMGGFVGHADIAIGDSSNKSIIVRNESFAHETTEVHSQGMAQRSFPCREATTSDLVYARIHGSGAANSSTQIAIYGCG